MRSFDVNRLSLPRERSKFENMKNDDRGLHYNRTNYRKVWAAPHETTCEMPDVWRQAAYRQVPQCQSLISLTYPSCVGYDNVRGRGYDTPPFHPVFNNSLLIHISIIHISQITNILALSQNDLFGIALQAHPKKPPPPKKPPQIYFKKTTLTTHHAYHRHHLLPRSSHLHCNCVCSPRITR